MMFCKVDEDTVHKTGGHTSSGVLRTKCLGIPDTDDGLIHPVVYEKRKRNMNSKIS